MRRDLLTACLLALPMTAAAHDTWILPARWSAPVGGSLAVDLTSGMGFPAHGAGVAPDRLVESKVRVGDAVSPLEVSRAAKPGKALRLTASPARAGVATFWAITRPRTLELKPEDVEHYLDEVGASDSIGAEWRRLPDKAWRETYVKIAKAFVRVGDAPGDESWREAVGASLELVPTRDPTALAVGQELSLVLLWNGQPLADLGVGAVGGAGAKPTLVRTDAQGRVRFRLDRAGPWLFPATSIRAVAGRPGEWESAFTTATLDVKP